jgi:hypothetical protein
LHIQQFSNDDDLEDAISQWFEEQDDFCFSGISSLPTKWRKCIKLRRDYIEK